MATFYNQATLSYNGISTQSNTTTGELVDVLAVRKTALTGTYGPGDRVTYVISIVNSGTTALTGLTVTDNLGAYTFDTSTLTPLTYTADAVRYYVNGVLQTAPTVVAGPPLVFSGISIPAGGDAVLVYETTLNASAPLNADSTIVNTITVTGDGLTTAPTDTETITVRAEPQLAITKSLSPTQVMENGQLTYTFTIENSGNTAADAADLAAVTDTFTPPLRAISVTFNGTAWMEPTNYTYDAATGAFATVPGQITVPAATYVQNSTTGAWTVTPGVSVLTVTGTI